MAVLPNIQPEHTPEELASPVNLQTVLLLTITVQQLTKEAHDLREEVLKGRGQKDTKIMLALLSIIAAAVIALSIYVIFF